MAFIRNLGAAAGGAAGGYLSAREDLRRQDEVGLARERGQREQGALNLKLDEAAREIDAWKRLGALYDQGAMVGNRNPAQTGVSDWEAKWRLASPDLAALLTGPAGNAPGLEAQQRSAPVPFVTQRRRAPRTLPFAGDYVGGPL